MEFHLLYPRQTPSRDAVPGQNMPSLWVFLIIVLAVLLGVVICTSFVMHMIQRRQRHVLSRRIARGEVDLEVLGIKVLNVPQEEIEKMPLYVFKSIPETAASAEAALAKKETAPHDYFQPVCSICLDDFVLNETKVRELPCRHIFHPECIDPFLRENSSLCPLCKRSSLPPGRCPIEVTNVLVRRERLTRRMREGRHVPQQYRRYQPPSQTTTLSRGLDRLRGSSAIAAPQPALFRDAPPAHGTPEVVETQESVRRESDTELGPMPSQEPSAPNLDRPPPDVARRGTLARRAWRRERIASLHAREFNAQAEEGAIADARRPLWRRVLGLS